VVLNRLDALINEKAVAGDRYDAIMRLNVDTEDFA